MNFLITVIPYLAFMWLVFVFPYNLSVLLKSIFTDMVYQYSKTDIITGCSISVLFLVGLPKLQGLTDILSYFNTITYPF